MTLDGCRIALVEDDEIMGASLAQRLELEGAEVLWLKQAIRGLHAIRTPRAPIHAVVCDIRLADGTGEDVFAALCQTGSPPPFLFITGYGTVEQAVRLMRNGASDYLTKPFDMETFLQRLQQVVVTGDRDPGPPVLGVSPAARRVEALAEDVAAADRPALITGERGTGKSLLARRMHALSDRRAAAFVEVSFARPVRSNGASIASGDAIRQAGSGTLFLNALDLMPADNQAELSAALDDGFDGLVISSARPDLHRRLASGGFRADLHARLCGVEVPIPPLRDRTEDAAWLLAELFHAANTRRARPLRGISDLTLEAVRAYPWPDNGREVRGRLRRAMALAGGDWLMPAHLFPERQAEGAFPSLMEVRDRAERAHIVAALERAESHVGEAAKCLKISRTTLWEKMQKFGL